MKEIGDDALAFSELTLVLKTLVLKEHFISRLLLGVKQRDNSASFQSSRCIWRQNLRTKNISSWSRFKKQSLVFCVVLNSLYLSLSFSVSVSLSVYLSVCLSLSKVICIWLKTFVLKKIDLKANSFDNQQTLKKQIILFSVISFKTHCIWSPILCSTTTFYQKL